MFNWFIKLFKSGLKSLSPKNISKALKPTNPLKRSSKWLDWFKGRRNKKMGGIALDSVPKPQLPTVSKPSTSKSVGTSGTKTGENKIDRILRKSRLVEQMLRDVGEMLRGKSSVKIDIPEFVKEVNRNIDSVKIPLENLEKMLDKQLEDLNIDFDEFDENSPEEYFDTLNVNSYLNYLDNWKNKFFSSGVLSETDDRTKDEIWGEIEEERDYSWFLDNKTGK